ncbi:DUF4231 domain-containing protein [Aliivibrio fischeri]|nr:DUF4231 domain-containing protein [Aliivibrio fischeri]MUK33820.1 DUF4231 domain-containing protein [Aliivibrio fischeri]OCH28997.1 hypothetical protein A6E12_08600 [Aliivibrio fischeri]
MKKPSEFLSTEINKSIEILKIKVSHQKKKTHIINGLSIMLGALITLTLGLKFNGYELWQKNIALTLGALLTIVSSWNAVFDYKKLWIRQKSTLLDLYQLKNELNYALSLHSNDPNDIEALFSRYQKIWELDGNEWRNIIYKSDKSTTFKNKQKKSK